MENFPGAARAPYSVCWAPRYVSVQPRNRNIPLRVIRARIDVCGREATDGASKPLNHVGYLTAVLLRGSRL